MQKKTSHYISITEASKILDRTLTGTRHIIKRENLRHRFVLRGHQKVCQVWRTDVLEIAAVLPPRKNRQTTHQVLCSDLKYTTKLEKNTGYLRVYMPFHPRAMCTGHVYEHWLVAEKMLGRFVTEKEQVHHINHVRDDNRIENLVVYPSRSAHMREAHAHHPEKYKGLYKRIKRRPSKKKRTRVKPCSLEYW